MTVRLGPDSSRYWLAAEGKPVARPFHLRWLLPRLLGQEIRRWWFVWGSSWLLVFAGGLVLALQHGATTAEGLAAGVLLIALPGLWGPQVVRPVGVDLPSMAVGIWAAVALGHGWWFVAVPLVLVAGCIKESAPIWCSLWARNPLLLVGLAAPLVRSILSKPELDEVTALPALREVHEHPIQTALRGRDWRSAWVMVAPWGLTLAALYRPSPWVLVTLAVAYLQLIVATDTVRLVQTAAGPPMAVVAALTIPTPWLLLAVIAHSFWWRQPEVI